MSRGFPRSPRNCCIAVSTLAPEPDRTTVAATAGAAAPPSRIVTSGRSSRRGRSTQLMLGACSLCGGRHVRVLTLAELLDDLVGERGDVVRVAARDEALVHVHLLVDPVSACVADVRLQRRPRGERAA